MDDFFFEIFIPSFRQQDKLRACLESLKNQNFKSFKVTLVDDASCDNYDKILDAGWLFKIDLIVNKVNKGAVNNMLHCMAINSQSQYIMVFHEDDLMHPGYLMTAHSFLSANNNISLCVSTMAFYNKLSKPFFEKMDSINVKVINEAKSLIHEFLIGKSISLSSCIFKKSELKPENFDLEKFSMLGDRPFMCSFAQHGKSILFADADFIMADDHSEGDSRWAALRVKHLDNLLNYYKSHFNRSNHNERRFIDIHLTRLAMENYTLLDSLHRPLRLRYILSNVLNGNISVKYFLLLFPTFRKAVGKIKGS